jgi:hypothetical protein
MPEACRCSMHSQHVYTHNHTHTHTCMCIHTYVYMYIRNTETSHTHTHTQCKNMCTSKFWLSFLSCPSICLTSEREQGKSSARHCQSMSLRHLEDTMNMCVCVWIDELTELCAPLQIHFSSAPGRYNEHVCMCEYISRWGCTYAYAGAHTHTHTHTHTPCIHARSLCTHTYSLHLGMIKVAGCACLFRDHGRRLKPVGQNDVWVHGSDIQMVDRGAFLTPRSALESPECVCKCMFMLCMCVCIYIYIYKLMYIYTRTYLFGRPSRKECVEKPDCARLCIFVCAFHIHMGLLQVSRHVDQFAYSQPRNKMREQPMHTDTDTHTHTQCVCMYKT